MIRIFFLFILLFGNLWSLDKYKYHDKFFSSFNGKSISGYPLYDCRQGFGSALVEGNPVFDDVDIDLYMYRARLYYFVNSEGGRTRVEVLCETLSKSRGCPKGSVLAKNGIDCVEDPNDDCPKYSKKIPTENNSYKCELCPFNEKPSEDGLSCVPACPAGQYLEGDKCVLDCKNHEKPSDDGKTCVRRCKFNQELNYYGQCVDSTECKFGEKVEGEFDQLTCVPACPAWQEPNEEQTACVDKCPSGQIYRADLGKCFTDGCPYNEKWDYETKSCKPIQCPEGHEINNKKECISCPFWQKLKGDGSKCIDRCETSRKYDKNLDFCLKDKCPDNEKWDYETKSCKPIQCPEGFIPNEKKDCVLSSQGCSLGYVRGDDGLCILEEKYNCEKQGKCWSSLHSNAYIKGHCLDCKKKGDCDSGGGEILTIFNTCEKCPDHTHLYYSIESSRQLCARNPDCEGQGGKLKVIKGKKYCLGRWLRNPECEPGVPSKRTILKDKILGFPLITEAYECGVKEEGDNVTLPLEFITFEDSSSNSSQGGSTGNTGNSGSQGDNNQDSQNQGGSTNQGDSSNEGGGTAGGGGSTGGSNSDPKPDTPQDPKPQEPTPPKKPDDTKPKEPKPDDSEPKPQNPDSQTPPPPTPPTNNNPPSTGGGGSGGGGSNTPKPNGGGGGGNPSAPASGDPLTRALNNLEGAVRSNTGTTAGNSNALGKNTDALNRLIDALNGGLGGGGGNGEGEGQGQGDGQGEGVDLAGLWDAPLASFEEFNQSNITGIDDFKSDLNRIVENVKSLGNGGLSLPNQKPATCGVDFEFYGKTIRLELCKFLHQVSNIIYFIVFTFITVAYFRWSLNTIFGTKV